MGSRQVLQTVEEYQKARIEFAQKIADLSTRPQNIESLQNADVMSLLRTGNDEAAFEDLRQAEAVGRPLGSDSFLSTLEASSGRRLKPQPTGRPRKQA
jgi:hypothetical protein